MTKTDHAKWFLTTIVCFFIGFRIVGCTMMAAEPPEMRPDKPIYQQVWGWGRVIVWPVGSVQKVRVPDPKTVAELTDALKQQDMRHKQAMKERDREQLAKEVELGGWIKLAGWVIVALGAAGHFCSSLGPIKSFASSILVLGFAGVLVGVGMQKTAQFDWIFNVAIVFLAAGVIGYVLYRARNWSVSHWAAAGLATLAKGDTT